MNCKKCGSKLRVNSKYCDKCGTKVSESNISLEEVEEKDKKFYLCESDIYDEINANSKEEMIKKYSIDPAFERFRMSNNNISEEKINEDNGGSDQNNNKNMKGKIKEDSNFELLIAFFIFLFIIIGIVLKYLDLRSSSFSGEYLDFSEVIIASAVCSGILTILISPIVLIPTVTKKVVDEVKNKKK